MMNSRLLLTALLFTSLSTSAYASTTGSVGSPKVSKGATSLEARAGYSEADESSSQDERFRTRVQLDHGFTDYYAGRIVVSQDKRKNDSYEHDAIKLENRFYLLKADQYGFDFGVRAAYSHKDGDKKPNSLEFGLYELVPLDKYELRLNQIFSHDVGDNSDDGISAELRAQFTGKISDTHRLGIESFHDFGNLSDTNGYDEQSHTIGPVLKGNVLGIKYETGYRVGISDSAPDHSFKLFVAKGF